MNTDLLTILITDLVESTATRARIGEERADALQRVHDDILRVAVTAARGEIVKGTGDGVMATFHSATDVLAAAVAIQQQLDTYSNRASAIAPIVARVGISVGDVVHQDGDIFGSAVIEAARLGAVAEAGQILCAELVRTLARGRGGFEFDLVGLLELKGLSEPLATCAVLWRPTAASSLPALPLPDDLVGGARLDFVGRESELHDAVGLVLGTETAAAVFVIGEPGLGKTRFATEVATLAHRAGAAVLFGRCDEFVRDPFQPFIQALRWHAAQLDDGQLSAALGSDPAPLVRLAPELGARLPLLEEVGRVTEVEQYRLFESVRSWLAHTGANGPVVLVLDDVHWADRPSLALLGHLLRGAGPARLCVIVTARDTKPDASETLASIVDDLGATGRTRVVALEGLGVEQIATLVAREAIVAEDHAALATRIAEETTGNALFVVALLASLRVGTSREGPLAADVRTAVRQRVRHLEDETQRLLQVAAVVGLEFSLRIAARACAEQDAARLARIEAAVDAGVVDEIGIDRFRFTHAIVRDVLAAELSASRRARLHASVAAAIEAELGADPPEYLRALAHHLAESNDPALMHRAIDLARRSAEQAIDQLAFETAVDDLGTALTIGAQLADIETATIYELLVAKGDAQVMAGAHRDALATLITAADLARAEQNWVAFAHAAISYEEAVWRPGLPGHGAAALLQEAIEHDLPRELRVLAQSSLGRALAYAGDFDAADQVSSATLTEARSIGEPVLLSQALESRMASFPLHEPMDWPLVLAYAEEIDALATTTPNPRSTLGLMCELNKIWAHFSLGHGAEGRACLRRLPKLAEMTGRRFDRYIALCIEQWLTFCAGDLTTAEQLAEEARELGTQLGEDVSGTHGVQMFLLRREQGRLNELAPLLRTVLKLNPSGGLWRPGLIAVLTEAGVVDEARELLDEFAHDDFAMLPRDVMFPAALCLLSQAAARVGARDAGATLERLVAPWGNSGVWIGVTVGFLGSAADYRAMVAGLAGRIDEAESLLDTALARHRLLELPLWVAHTLADRAELRARRGDATGARPDATEARLLAERHGLVAVGRQLDALDVE